jgi:hypothetical protein
MSVEWKEENGALTPRVDGQEVAWAPQPGSQEAFIDCPLFEVLYHGNRGGGKPHPLTTPILTPDGWRQFGELMPDDVVFGSDGQPTQILDVFDAGEQTVYRVRFSDGTTVDAAGCHKWRAYHQPRKGGQKSKWKTATTEELGEWAEAGRVVKLPARPCLDWPERDIGVDPYLLGLMVGDGTFRYDRKRRNHMCVQFGTPDDQLADYVEASGFSRHNTARNFHDFGVPKAHPLVQALTDLELMDLKSPDRFVPDVVKYNSRAVRVAFLQGLLDADGTLRQPCGANLSTSSPRLRDDVMEMLRSLGGYATYNGVRPSGKQVLVNYVVRLTFPKDIVPFRLERKIRQYDHVVRGAYYQPTVKSVDRIGTERCACIAVANQDHLYSVGSAQVLTLNTDCLIMDFLQHVGQGFGAEWQGILFRQSHPQLADVIKKSKKWIPRIWPSACYNEAKSRWSWPTGEELKFSHMAVEEDYWNWHGQQFTWIGWEELTTWPDDKCYKVMMSCVRSPHPNIPKKIRATTNPYGNGHSWVKKRFNLGGHDAMIGDVIRDSEKSDPRVAIKSSLEENKVLLTADPDYVEKVKQAARNPAELEAWINGSWDIVAGGMFDDIWEPDIHVIPDIPLDAIPRRWKMNRSYDHGQSRPFSVGWWAKSNGEPIKIDGRVIGGIPGDVIRVAEWYGWTGTPNEGVRMLSGEIGLGIKEREEQWGIAGRVFPGPADSSIYDPYEPGKTVAGDMSRVGVRWTLADKAKGSRKHGWEQIRKYLKGSVAPKGGVREAPGLFICRRCDQALRLLPVTPRDQKDLDDVDTKSEDHLQDEMRYRIREKTRVAKSWSW